MQMKLPKISLFLFISILLFNFAFHEIKAQKNYDFNKPILNDILPASLHEISGLAITDSTTIACIQD